MARKNIFQIISEKHNNEQEINRLEALIHNAKGVAVYNNIILGVSFDNVSPDYMTIEDFVDQYAFKQWKFRGTCIDLKT